MAAFTVTAISPACGSTQVQRPMQFIVNFSDPCNPSTVAPTDFTLGGTGASTVVLSGGNQIATFTFTVAPSFVPGLVTMAIAANAINRQSDNLGITAFSCTLTWAPTYAANMVVIPFMDYAGDEIDMVNSGLYPRRYVPEPNFSNIISPVIWGDFVFSPGYVGKLYLFEWFLENVAQPVVFSLSSGALPPGLTLSTVGITALGAVSGTPTTLGIYSFSLRATAPDGTFDIKNFSIQIFSYPPVWGSIIFPPAYVGVPYLFDWYLENIAYPCTFSLVDGLLPPGLALANDNSMGILTGTATTVGTYQFTLRATNDVGTADQSFTAVVVTGPDSGGGGFIYGN
jgi:hypothetical protein